MDKRAYKSIDLNSWKHGPGEPLEDNLEEAPPFDMVSSTNKSPFKQAINSQLQQTPLKLIDKDSTQKDIREADILMMQVASTVLHAGWAGVNTMADCYLLTDRIMDFLERRQKILAYTKSDEEDVEFGVL